MLSISVKMLAALDSVVPTSHVSLMLQDTDEHVDISDAACLTRDVRVSLVAQIEAENNVPNVERRAPRVRPVQPRRQVDLKKLHSRSDKNKDLTPRAASALSQQLLGAVPREPSRARRTPQPRAQSTFALRVLFYDDPSQRPMKVSLHPKATVADALECVMRQYGREGRSPAFSGLSAGDFELRMVDDDDSDSDSEDSDDDFGGNVAYTARSIKVDEDFPPLQRSRQIRLFDVRVVALCRKSGSARALGTRDQPQRSRALTLATFSKGNTTLVRVSLPQLKWKRVMRIDKNATLRDLLSEVARKADAATVGKTRPLTPQFWGFYDRTPDANTTALSADTRVRDVGEDVVLHTKTGLAPVSSVMRPHRVSAVAEAATLPDYAEWTIVKTNRRGRRQQRVLGSDRVTLYNKKASSSTFGYTHHATRRIADIESVECDVHDSRRFVIRFRGGAHWMDCEASSANDAEACVRRLRVLRRALEEEEQE